MSHPSRFKLFLCLLPLLTDAIKEHLRGRNVELFTFSSTNGFMANNRLCELIGLLLFAASMYRHKLTDPFCHSD